MGICGGDMSDQDRIAEIKARRENNLIDDIDFLLSRIETLTRCYKYYRDSREKVRIELVQANYRLRKLEDVRAAAEDFYKVVPDLQLNNYQEDFRYWLGQALAACEPPTDDFKPTETDKI